ncbi:hypothetical protein B0H11DRAFT_2236851 [Mycena galericulata]|nr:hypothetical protein B0H11DRAFT_2236851 [Mycena galericulata]
MARGAGGHPLTHNHAVRCARCGASDTSSLLAYVSRSYAVAKRLSRRSHCSSTLANSPREFPLSWMGFGPEYELLSLCFCFVVTSARILQRAHTLPQLDYLQATVYARSSSCRSSELSTRGASTSTTNHEASSLRSPKDVVFIGGLKIGRAAVLGSPTQGLLRSSSCDAPPTAILLLEYLRASPFTPRRLGSSDIEAPPTAILALERRTALSRFPAVGALGTASSYRGVWQSVVKRLHGDPALPDIRPNPSAGRYATAGFASRRPSSSFPLPSLEARYAWIFVLGYSPTRQVCSRLGGRESPKLRDVHIPHRIRRQRTPPMYPQRISSEYPIDAGLILLRLPWRPYSPSHRLANSPYPVLFFAASTWGASRWRWGADTTASLSWREARAAPVPTSTTCSELASGVLSEVGIGADSPVATAGATWQWLPGATYRISTRGLRPRRLTSKSLTSARCTHFPPLRLHDEGGRSLLTASSSRAVPHLLIFRSSEAPYSAILPSTFNHQLAVAASSFRGVCVRRAFPEAFSPRNMCRWPGYRIFAREYASTRLWSLETTIRHDARPLLFSVSLTYTPGGFADMLTTALEIANIAHPFLRRACPQSMTPRTSLCGLARLLVKLMRGVSNLGDEQLQAGKKEVIMRAWLPLLLRVYQLGTSRHTPLLLVLQWVPVCPSP